MDSALAMAPSSFPLLRHQKSTSNFPLIFKHTSKQTIKVSIKASSNPSSSSTSIAKPFKTAAAALIFSAAVFGNFHRLPAKADPPPPPPPTLESDIAEKAQVAQHEEDSDSPLTKFLESGSTVSIEAMKAYIEEKLENGEDELALKILKKLRSAQPDNLDWKFLTARLLSEMGNTEEARELFEEILSKNPLSYNALFENALLMDKCGEGENVVKRLEAALAIAEEEKNADAARYVRLIIAQVNFLQKNVEESLRKYDELEKEDPNDFRPAFCKGVIYSLIDKNEEAKEEFDKFQILSPERFDVQGFLRSSLSRMKLFGTDHEDK